MGNLSLTKDNASYGNKPFPDKKGIAGIGKPCYAESPFFMERELATVDDWNQERLVERRDRLIEWAIERWRVQGDRDQEVRGIPKNQDGDLDDIDELGGEGVSDGGDILDDTWTG